MRSHAFGLEVHNYRTRQGPDAGRVFYASPGSPTLPSAAGRRSLGVGRILGYTPLRGGADASPRRPPTAGCGRATCSTPTTPPHWSRKASPVRPDGDRVRVRRLSTARHGHVHPPRPASRHWCPRWWAGCRSTSSVRQAWTCRWFMRSPRRQKLVLLNARPTTTNDGGGAFVKLGGSWSPPTNSSRRAVELLDRVGCDRLFTATDFAPVRTALERALGNGTTAFNASGDLAGLECKGGQRWSEQPGPDDVGVDAVASLPEMTAVGGRSCPPTPTDTGCPSSPGTTSRSRSERPAAHPHCSSGPGGRRSASAPNFLIAGWCPMSHGVRPVHRRAPGVPAADHRRAAPRGGADLGGSVGVDERQAHCRGAKPWASSIRCLYEMARTRPWPPGFAISTTAATRSASGTTGYDMVTGLGTRRRQARDEHLAGAGAHTTGDDIVDGVVVPARRYTAGGAPQPRYQLVMDCLRSTARVRGDRGWDAGQ